METARPITVVYALPAEQHLIEVPFRANMTAADAVALSGLRERFPEILGS